MASKFNSLTYAGIVLVVLLFVTGAFGHSYLTSPTSRSNQKQTTTGCRGPACLGPCDVKKAQARTAAVTIARGATIRPQWPRNNHAGGFIRFAWAKTSDSDTASSFDAGVQSIYCHEIGGCKPDSPSDPNGGDSAPADGSFQPCQTTITVPAWLTDGTWTLQWAWFGGAFALGDYYSCVDYIISGGPSGSQPAASYIGGDYTYPGQNKCKFFNTDRLHRCVNEPCDNPVYSLSAEKSGPAFGIASTGNTPAPSPPAVPSTTGRSTTGRSTTGRASTPTPSPPSPTPSPPSPTPSPPSPTPSPPSPTPSGNTQNCAGVTTLSTSQATMVSVDNWGSGFRAVIQIHVQENVIGVWYLDIIWPSAATSLSVSTSYNAGTLQCQGTTPSRHAVIKSTSWAASSTSGTIMTVEVMVTNSNNMNTQFLMANTQLKVFKA